MVIIGYLIGTVVGLLQSYISGTVNLLLNCHSKPCGCNQGWNRILNWTVLLSSLSNHYFCTCSPPDEWAGWISIRSDEPGPRWQIQLKFGMPITCQRTPMIQGTVRVTHYIGNVQLMTLSKYMCGLNPTRRILKPWDFSQIGQYHVNSRPGTIPGQGIFQGEFCLSRSCSLKKSQQEKHLFMLFLWSSTKRILSIFLVLSTVWDLKKKMYVFLMQISVF